MSQGEAAQRKFFADRAIERAREYRERAQALEAAGMHASAQVQRRKAQEQEDIARRNS